MDAYSRRIVAEYPITQRHRIVLLGPHFAASHGAGGDP